MQPDIYISYSLAFSISKAYKYRNNIEQSLLAQI
ncbi:hypothetical protein NOS3756_35060 [Nostoc sp. NIES-3756]|nr:hypothetical protein NOS3756_35060 [Nostoc sp. NIES-3756]